MEALRFIKKIVERGNVTIPSDVREALEIDEGDIVEFEIVSIVKKTPKGTDESQAPATRPEPSPSPQPNSTRNNPTRGNFQ